MRDTILITDNLTGSRAVLRGILEESFIIVESSDEKSAIKYIADEAQKLCAVILDASSPASGASSVLKFMDVSGLIGKLPVIFITSFNQDDDEIREFAGEIDDVIEKPFSDTVVRRRVRNLVELYNYRRSR